MRDTTLKSKEWLAKDSLTGTKLNSALEKLTILLKIPELKKTNKIRKGINMDLITPLKLWHQIQIYNKIFSA